MTITIILLWVIGVAALFVWLIRGAQAVHHQSELRLSNKRSPILCDYKHLAKKKPSNEFDAGALTGAAVTLIMLALLIAALPAKADVFFDAGVSAHRALSPVPDGEYRRWDINETHNPYGILAIGYRQKINKHFELSLTARHESSIEVGDCGTDSLQLTLRWAPWSKQ